MSQASDLPGSDSDASKRNDQDKRRDRAAKRHQSTDLLEKKLKVFENKIMDMFSSWKKDMNSKFDNLEKQLSGIKSDIEKSMEFMASQIEETQQKMDSVEKECKANQDRISLVEDMVENLLRDARSSSIELRNVPFVTGETKEDLVKYVVKIGESVKTPISPTDLKDVFRMPGKAETNKPIIAELTSTMRKNKMIKAVKNYNVSNLTNKLNTSHLGLRGTSSPVFVTEHLTSKANRLYFLARDLVKAGKYKYCWTANGKIYLRKAEGSPMILIKKEDQISDLNKQI